jgi:hypothetical protein
MAKGKKSPATPKLLDVRRIEPKYSKSGRGRKEAFRCRKDTLFRKSQELATATGAQVLTLVYQPHRGQYHVFTSSDGSEVTWPFDLDDFVSPLYF